MSLKPYVGDIPGGVLDGAGPELVLLVGTVEVGDDDELGGWVEDEELGGAVPGRH